MPKRWSTARAATMLAGVALVAAACSSSGSSEQAIGSGAPSPSPSPSASASASAHTMPMQPGAAKMHVSVTSPGPGLVLTGNVLTLHVTASGYHLSCAWAGKPARPGIGHYHVLLDGSLINMFCTPTARISMQDVAPGTHTIEVVPAQDDHAEVLENAQKMPFTYRPKHPLPAVAPSAGAGAPSVRILEPKNGAVLHGAFAVKVAFQNFHSSCGLLGKPDVAGFGHWHVNLDTMSGPMMGMGTMLGMACTTTFHGTTVGLEPGTTHTLFALLTDNGHAPLGPFAKITFTVG